MSNLTLGSLFDGSGGFPLGGLLSGITPVWASEIEPFPIRVTTKRLPQMKHYGDVSLMDGGSIEPVDIITFGSPCQDMSIAGKREGLDGNRSGLFYQAVRIIKEMREKTNGKYPRYIVWENVPGAFSSNKGEDFRCVLESICRIADETVSVPSVKKWQYAGSIMGDGYSVAWRLLDAQYWGVPQRRKRIYLVADLTGGSAGQVLFESEGLSGYSAEGFRTWQRTDADAAEGACQASSLCLNNQPFVVETPKTLKIRSGCEGGGKGALIQDDKSATLGTHNDQTLFQPKVYGICSKDSNAMKSANPHSGFYEADTSRTLDGNGGNPSCNQGGMAVVALEGNGARPSHKGSGYSNEGVSFTLNATEQHAVAYGIDRATYNMGQKAKFGIAVEEEVEPTIVAKGPGAVGQPVYHSSKNSFHTNFTDEAVNDTLVPTDYKDPPTVSGEPDYIVRRLTPTECARLQGFPDWWCDDLGTEKPTDEEMYFWYKVFETWRKATNPDGKPKTSKQVRKWLTDPYSDSAEYKMWGNGVALPCVVFVLSGIVYYSQFRGGQETDI